MARKTTNFTATDGRDDGKRFLITEMSASQSEEWAARALFAAMSCGVEIPDEVLGAGLAGVAAIGIKALGRVPFEIVKPLFDEMMTCVQYEFEPGRAGGTRALIETDIEEVATRLKLRKAVLDLHLEGFLAAAPSKQASGAAVAASA
ncbi:hypothetical protein [Burkholderia vietnamiensis]|uniref:Uncharacterized protein n=1 Tax=Burkholderia vietnamiensis TaxID=60552 RepID=A0AA44Y197_BURVI|nr:hypothetical protein [Burkholderia vietnamiensis]KVS07765.1 hypothetical protein WK32_09520 [Burkholderia vietnamiensis]PRH42421.1 hypothetical protein C6T65_10275 [Burkholderia vietnamiensis]